MKTIYTYFKNSNTGEIVMQQKFIETPIKFPIHYYVLNEKGKNESIEDFDPTGFVEISKKKYDREVRKRSKISDVTGLPECPDCEKTRNNSFSTHCKSCGLPVVY